MSKIFGFLLGVVVALAGPAAFGVLAAEGGIELNAKEMALAYGIGALIFWAVVSYFSGAAALGAFVVFGTMIYAVHWIPNRMTNFLNDVPGVTTGMIEGVKAYTLNGVVPILAVISLVFGIQSIVRSAQRRRRARVEAERLQREQELAQAQQAAEVAPYQPPAAYPVAGGDYQQPVAGQYGGYGNSSYEDLFDDEPEPEPVRPRNQADEQTAMFATAPAEQEEYAEEDYEPDNEDETRLVPTDGDDTVMVPTGQHAPDDSADEVTEQAETPATQEETAVHQPEPVAQSTDPAEDETQLTPASTTAPATPEEPTAVAQVEPSAPAPSAPAPSAPASASSEDPTVVAPTSQPSAQAPSAPAPSAPAPSAPAPASSEDPTVVAPTSQPSAQAPTAPAPSASAPSAPAAPAPSAPAPAEHNASAPASSEDPTVVAPTSQPSAQAPTAPAPTAPAPRAPAEDPTVVAPTSQPSAQAPSAPAPAQHGDSGDSGQSSQGTPQAAVAPVPSSEPAPVVQRREEVGQQYRERMEGPEEDETGEHHFGAFENPMFSDETLPQAPRVMDAPGQFRPAGT